MTAFQSHEVQPDDDCTPATAVVAARTRMDAVRALRSAGFAGRDVTKARGGSPEQRAALVEPGVVRWCDWYDRADDRAWHRTE